MSANSFDELFWSGASLRVLLGRCVVLRPYQLILKVSNWYDPTNCSANMLNCVRNCFNKLFWSSVILRVVLGSCVVFRPYQLILKASNWYEPTKYSWNIKTGVSKQFWWAVVKWCQSSSGSGQVCIVATLLVDFKSLEVVRAHELFSEYVKLCEKLF